MKEAGVKRRACKACDDAYGVSSDLVTSVRGATSALVIDVLRKAKASSAAAAGIPCPVRDVVLSGLSRIRVVEVEKLVGNDAKRVLSKG